MKVIVVTGGIGSGKSSACRFLEKEYGWPVYYADSKVKELYVKSPDLLDSIEKELDCRFRNDEGVFVPSLLAAVIFSDKTALDKVEALVFPQLMADFDQWKSVYDSPYVILESATILEKPALKGVGDITVLVDAPLGIRAARAAAAASVKTQPDNKFCPLRCSANAKCATGEVHRRGRLSARERRTQRLSYAAFFGYFLGGTRK